MTKIYPQPKTEDLGKPKTYTCECGHVRWAHWENGQCAHCNCKTPKFKI